MKNIMNNIGFKIKNLNQNYLLVIQRIISVLLIVFSLILLLGAFSYNHANSLISFTSFVIFIMMLSGILFLIKTINLDKDL